ncbi:MAG: aminotransferase class I/II-fold pyridoxal phosphate-dependent enzyme [Anaerolineae bacterium]
MRPSDFGLERYFATYEFRAPYVLSASDCEPLSLADVLSMADAESLCLWQDLRLGYTESQGHPLLRHEIARTYGQVEPDDVLVVAPEEGILIAMWAMLNPGDHVIAVCPAYQSLYEIARSLGCRVTCWVPDEEAGWRFRLEELEAQIGPDTRLIVINFPHNPTGAMIGQEQLDALLHMAVRKGIRVFSDEMYRLLEYDGSDRLVAAVDRSTTAVSLSGMSKAYALAGLRLGWLITRDRALMQRMVRLKDYTTICASAPSEVLALMALRDGGRIIHRNLGIIHENLALFESFLAAHGGLLHWHKPRAGTVGFARLLGAEAVERFCERVREEAGVLLAPGGLFNWHGNHLRIGLGRTNMSEALTRLDEFLAQGPGDGR